MKIITAKNVTAYAGQPGILDMEVEFSHLPGQLIPFTARKDDSEPHGRALYSMAMAGQFGAIAELEARKPSEQRQQELLAMKQQQAAATMAPLEDAEKLGIITPAESTQLAAWRTYRVTLYRLPQSEGWPTDVEWPAAPTATP